METMFQIKVDEEILRGAETIAKRTNSTVTKLFCDFVTNLAAQQDRIDTRNEVNSYEELVASLQQGREQYQEGKIISHEEMIHFLDTLKKV